MAWHEAFSRRMEDLLGAEAPAFFDALEAPPRKALRLSPRRTDGEAAIAALSPFLGEAIPFAENAWFLREDGASRHPLHTGGAAYIQDPAAMAPAAAVTVRPDDSILDLCAAPGGKSLALAERLGRKGILVCNELAPVRRRVLMQNLERCGVSACVFGLDASMPLPDAWDGAFDLVVCDVPCSGEGMFRKDPEAAALWSPEKVALCAALQEKILENAAFAVAPGGQLLYATCTWSVEEDEGQIARFLDRHPDFTLADPLPGVVAASRPGVPLPGLFPDKCRRFYPHVFPGEGQFLAILVRGGERPLRITGEPVSGKPHPDEKVVRAFLAESLETVPPGDLLCRDGNWFLAPPRFSRNAASPGLLLGEVRKGRFLPHHRLFTARDAAFRRDLILDEAGAKAFLAGQELPADLPDGWARATFLGCPLGGVKVSGGKAKNHYPKGLRR